MEVHGDTGDPQETDITAGNLITGPVDVTAGADPVPIMPPYYAAYVIKRTSRVYRHCAMKFTLGTIKASRLPHVLGVCSDDARLVQWANAAQERLMARGRWWGTVVRAKFCVADGCLTWPREVAVIEKVRLCGKPIIAHGLWYEFTDYVDPSCCGCVFAE